MRYFALAAMLSALAISPASAQDTINWLHLETNPGMVELMNEAVTEYKGLNPGANFELQFLENEAYKAKLTTLLQSNDAPDIVYSWGGGVLDDAGQGRRAARHRRRRRARDQDQYRSGGRRRLHPRRQALRHGPARFAGRLLVQQGAVRQGRPRRRHDEHLGRLPRRRQEAQGRRHHADLDGRGRQVAGAFLLVVSGGPPGRRGRLQRRQARRRRRLCRRALRRSRQEVPAACRARALPGRLPDLDPRPGDRLFRRRQGRDPA